MSSVHDEFGVFDMPYMIKDRKHMAKVEKQVLPGIFKNLESKTGYKVLAVWENGFRQITNNKRPINTPSDLKGIKLEHLSQSGELKCSKLMAQTQLQWLFQKCLLH